MWAVDGAVGVVDPQLGIQLFRAQPAVVVFGHALAIQVVEVGAQAAFLFRVACGAVQHAALAVVAVDTLALQHAVHFIGDAVQQVDAGAALLRRQGGKQAVFAQQVSHQPATIAPGGTETGDVGVDHRYVQLWRLALEVVGGPQAGVAGADDAHIRQQVFAQGRAGAQWLVELIHPQAERAQGVHRVRLHIGQGLWAILVVSVSGCLTCVHAGKFASGTLWA
ncbi:hypothetical protein D3C81_1248220 [compost metagenome]